MTGYGFLQETRLLGGTDMARSPTMVKEVSGPARMTLTCVSLPVGWRRRECPSCGQRELVGALIRDDEGRPLIEGADESDPSVLCLSCLALFD